MGRRWVAGALAGLVLIGGGGCGDDGDGAEGPSTEADDPTTTAEQAEEVEETTTTVEELTIDVIRTHLEEEHPDEAALVDWTIFRWVSIGGYTAHVPAGTSADEGLAVCEALAEIVHPSSDVDPIAVVVGVEETPLAGSEGPSDPCAPA